MNGILLFAHGSRDPQWVGPFEKIRAAVQQRRPDCAAELGYLEHSAPDFMAAADALVARGVTVIKVVPLFLGPGGHVRGDVPKMIERAMVRHTGVRFVLQPFIGDAPAVLAAIADYACS